jgi:hypothetical protein
MLRSAGRECSLNQPAQDAARAPLREPSQSELRGRIAARARKQRWLSSTSARSSRDTLDAVGRRRPEHHSHSPASAAGTAKALSQPAQRKVSAAGSDQRCKIELHSEVAFPFVFQSFPPVVEAAHMHRPGKAERLA